MDTEQGGGGTASEVVPRAYTYAPLPPGSSIRLVRLLPGKPFETIRVEILVSDLGATRTKSAEASVQTRAPRDGDGADGPKDEYEALSYVWGSEADKVTIFVQEGRARDASTFRVTRNLGVALRYLRHETEIRTFWIDALCINQADEVEKTHQVSMMTRIYGGAKLVKVWLGSAADNSDIAMKALDDADDQVDFMDKENQGLRRALESLAQRDYWTRVWVVQELFKAKHVKILCGGYEADWTTATTVFQRFMEARAKALFGGDLNDHPRLHRNLLRRVASSSLASKLLDTRPMETIGYLATHRKQPECSRGPDWLLDMLVQLRHFGATDPRDKVFSILGLLAAHVPRQGAGFNLRVDYSLSFLDVSVEFFKYSVFAPREPERDNLGDEKRTLDQPGLLNILGASQPDTNPAFPSWLPDFSRDNGMQRWPHQSPYWGWDLKAQPEISHDNLILSAFAVKIGEISSTTEDDDDVLATDYLSLLSRLSHFIELISKSDGLTGMPFLTFWRCLDLNAGMGTLLSIDLANSPLIRDEQLDPFVKALELISSSVFFQRDRSAAADDEMSTEEIIHVVASAFLHEFRKKSYQRRFAIFQIAANKAAMAMVPQNARVGDQLYRLGDCDFLVLLRRAVSGAPYFQFLGPCHARLPYSVVAGAGEGVVERIAIH